jgi:hypothetical protein
MGAAAISMLAALASGATGEQLIISGPLIERASA